MDQIDEIIQKIERLETIPVVIHKILVSLGDPDSPLEDLIHIIEHDPAITANLLKICNSAYVGLPKKVDSVHRAVTILGVQRVAELVLTRAFSPKFMSAQKGYNLAMGDLWKQSVAAAMIARKLAERHHIEDLPAVYTAALLKDIGKVVLHEYVGHVLNKIQVMVSTDNLSFVEAEKACIGMDHATLGGIIARKWNFSDQLCLLIEHHHIIDEHARRNPAATVLYLADMVAMMVGTGTGVDRLAYHIYEDKFDDFYLNKDELRALMLMYIGFYKGAGRLLGVT